MADPKDPWRCRWCRSLYWMTNPKRLADRECHRPGIPFDHCPGFETCTRVEKREKEETR